KVIFLNINKMKLFGFNVLYNKEQSLIKQKVELEKLCSEIKSLIEESRKISNDIKEREESLKILINEQSIGNPYLANIIAEYFYYRDLEIADYLKHKSRPSLISSQEVKKHANEKRELRKMYRITYNRIKLYENIFPFIAELEANDIDFLLNQKSENNIAKDNEDPVREYVPEYDNLDEAERNQRALDRYLKNRNKSNWEIGKMYERYIGYLYEQKGYKVDYIGIEKGYEDLGRDLICIKNNETHVVQCKYWASYKEIKEAHINQLYGTTVKHFIDRFKEHSYKIKNSLFPELLIKDELNIKAVFVTSTKLSKTAKDFADALGVKIVSEKPLGEYPMIKCNLNTQTGDNIYHLPIDQHYDRVLMSNENRIYVKTVKEAMDLGCRRSYKWISKN
ncbi:MAG TPA: restriction endonuclease, partial [Flavobacterium sp.]|nr:restriction endonuclease [Flavobacterium sp.]